MRRLLRPVMLVAMSAVLAAGVGLIVFQGRPGPSRPVALPLGRGDREIAWLYGATNAAAWERFVAALGRSGERLRGEYPELKVAIGLEAFPQQTDSVPEAALQWPGGRLVFRWYKLTSTWSTADWVAALLQRSPPPLAIVGGNTSDAARELAFQLQQLGESVPEVQRPVLILTTATADWVRAQDVDSEIPPGPPEIGPPDDESGGVRLSRIYPGRTFRFCFNNRQMAVALTHFLWSRDDLRPGTDPVHLVRWEDDSYSRDLLDGFCQALPGLVAAESTAEIAWVSGCVAVAGLPPLAGGILPLARAGPQGSAFRLNRPLIPQFIDSSVGTFYEPNRFEAEAARNLLLDLEREPLLRSLLVVTGQAAPSRRFLRALARTAPIEARRFVVATGDALAFNNIYRDRRVTWPVQDLPFDLVLFCHHNPIDGSAGFLPGPEGRGQGLRQSTAAATGTEDLLLCADISEALFRAVAGQGQAATDATALAGRLNDMRVADDHFGYDAGGPLFTPHGNRRGGTGEHVVCLRPQFDGDRVLPRATIEVWAWRTGPEGNRAWQRVGEPLPVTYDETQPEGSSP